MQNSVEECFLPRILYLAKLSFVYYGRVRMFTGMHILKKYISYECPTRRGCTPIKKENVSYRKQEVYDSK
jgi:hypothetical protein